METGLDVYLLDESDAAIIDPATFLLVMTKAMNDAVEAETVQVPNNKLVKPNDGMKKAKVVKGKNSGSGVGDYENDAVENPKTAGLGSGTNGSMVVARPQTQRGNLLL